MSFNINNWGRWSVSYNSFPPNAWGYTGIKNGENDSLDVMKVDGFFDPVGDNFLQLGHLIYLEGDPTGAPVFPSKQWVVVTGIDPVVVKPLNGLAPIVTSSFTASIVASAVGFVQVFNFPGILPSDTIMVNAKANPASVRIESAVAGTDDFTITFSVNPGAGMFIDVILFRQAFS